MKIWDNLVVVIENMFLHTHTHTALYFGAKYHSAVPLHFHQHLFSLSVPTICSPSHVFRFLSVAQKSNVPLFFVFFPLSLSLVGGVYLRLLRGQAYF